MDIKIRTVTEHDIDSIINACLIENWTTFHLRRQAFMESLKNCALIVAYDGDVFVGFARAISDGLLTTFICELLVIEAYRGKGIGKKLVQHIWDIFPETRIDLISEADGFYEKLGFRTVGTGFRNSKWYR